MTAPVHCNATDFKDLNCALYIKQRVLAFLGMLALVSVSACADGHVQFPTSAAGQRALGDDVEIIVLDATNIGSYTSPVRGHRKSSLSAGGQWTYLVGPGDILSVIVFNHPELTLPAGPQRSATESGFQVASNGTISYPYIGNVTARGRSVDRIRDEIAQRLADFIPDPQVEVRVAQFNSQSIVVSGEVESPQRMPLTTVPIRLIDAISTAGGFTDDADQREVVVQRGGRSYVVDANAFLVGGVSQNNPLLQNGDVVNVRRRRAEEAFLLGEIGRPSALDLSREPLSLTQGITRAGGLDNVRANARGVFVFRAGGPGTRVFQLNTQNPVGLVLGTRFLLEPGDVVYVTRAPIQRWNDTISRILPSVQAIDVTGRVHDRVGN